MTRSAFMGEYERSLISAAIERRARMSRRPFPQEVIKVPVAVVRPPSGEICNRPHASRSREIIAQVLDKHGITKEALKSDARSRELVRARQEASYRLREEAFYTFPHIAVVVGYEDHTTSLYSYRQHAKRLAEGRA